MSFAEEFEGLTGHRPFPWQAELYARIRSGNPPSACDLPTGLGKTSVIAVWLLALANGGRDVPRRLVYVVNRRTVVDQATAEVEAIRRRVLDPDRLELRPVAAALSKMSALRDATDHVPLAISTLRGQFADNREWSADPSRPAIILGTVDMIGSRLLFSGYGLGFKTRPLHAGFLAQDVLLVHDESHLEPAFQHLLREIVDEQRRGREFRSFHVMELSATSRALNENDVGGRPASSIERAEVLALSDSDMRHPIIHQRLQAKKSLSLHELESDQKLSDHLYQLAIAHEGTDRAVLVFARGVEDVTKVAEKLRKLKDGESRTLTLTGTMRGLERDKLVTNGGFQRFLPESSRTADIPLADRTVYLVCTSAGEVGVNISADHLVCDLTTYESMAQRFGRVNRFGLHDDTRIDVLHPKHFDADNEYHDRLRKTLALLQQLEQLGGEASPAALNRLDPKARSEAFSPPPKFHLASDILFDSWSLTSIRERLPGRPPVEPYLHGTLEGELPETQVAWRDEVQIVRDELLDRHDPKDLLDDYPLKPHEVLKDRSDRVFKCLQSLKSKKTDAPIWIIHDEGKVEVCLLSEISDKERISNKTVLLPPDAGGLKDGLLTGNPSDEVGDVADLWLDEAGKSRRRRRIRIEEEPRSRWEEMRLIRTLDTDPDAGDLDESERESQGRYWAWYARARSADDDSSRTSLEPVTWDEHTDQVADHASRIAESLDLPSELKIAVRLAAWLHDLGKKRELWQRGIGNPNPTDWHAKSGGDWRPLEITPYRHEFGSLVDSMSHPEFERLEDDQKDLVLHLVAAHHGFGRPHFPVELVFDPIRAEVVVDTAARAVARRFARLQRRYGRWGLAYIESILRAADYAASANPRRLGAENS